MDLQPKVGRHGPRIRRVAVLTAALALVAVGCGTSGSAEGATGSTSVATTSPPPPVLDAGHVESALLTLSDLPPGWTLTESGTDDGSTGPVDDFCPAASNQQSGDDLPSAHTQFKMADPAPVVIQTLGSARDANGYFDDIVAVLDSCIGQRWPDDFDGTPATMTMMKVSGPSVGDRSASFRMVGTADDVPVSMTVDFTVVVRATVLELYGSVNVSSPVTAFTQLPAADFADIVEKGDAKVVETLESAASDDEPLPA